LPGPDKAGQGAHFNSCAITSPAAAMPKLAVTTTVEP
jgi:hypothetical protein